MKRFYSSRMIMIGIFLCGLVLIGIGTGVAFGEYSTFEYGGEVIIGNQKSEKVVLEQTISTKKKAKKTILNTYIDCDNISLKEDKKVPEGIVQYVVEYNPDYVIPMLEYEKFEENDYSVEDYNSYEGQIYLSGHRVVDDLAMMMECKDDILKKFKEKKISSYDYSVWKSVTVKVNPKTRKYIEERL